MKKSYYEVYNYCNFHGSSPERLTIGMGSPYPSGIVMCQSDSSIQHLKRREVCMKYTTIKTVTTIGIDLAKNSFSLVRSNDMVNVYYAKR